MSEPSDSHRRAAHGSAAMVAGLGGLGLAAVAVRRLAAAGTPRIRSRGDADGASSIAVLESVRIGDSDQWVLERSEDTRNPIVLYLHGGPGTSQLTLNRRNTRQLERYFTIVNWDQRGAGKSYAAMRDADRMNIDQFVEDTRELSQYLLKKFDQDRFGPRRALLGKCHRRIERFALPRALPLLRRNRPGRQHGGSRGSLLPVDARAGERTR